MCVGAAQTASSSLEPQQTAQLAASHFLSAAVSRAPQAQGFFIGGMIKTEKR
jgi:hypothetical protein